jgi:epsilon-lactone hydrolase
MEDSIMSKEQREQLDQIMRNGPLDIGGDPIEQRALFVQMLTSRPLSEDVETSEGTLGEIPIFTITVKGATTDNVLLWFHGGWYVMGSPRTSAGLAADVARRSGARVLSVDYRLAPEHPYPAALEDAQMAYRSLLESGMDPARVAFVGESAGAGLATATMASLHELDLPQPSCAVLFSPWSDLTLSGASMQDKVGIDPSFVPEKVQVRAKDYVASADPADPGISPLFASLKGLPPMLIQGGSNEILLDDSTRLAARAATDDVAVILDVTPGVPHLFQAFAAIVEEGDLALGRVANFLSAHLGAAPPCRKRQLEDCPPANPGISRRVKK